MISLSLVALILISLQLSCKQETQNDQDDNASTVITGTLDISASAQVLAIPLPTTGAFKAADISNVKNAIPDASGKFSLETTEKKDHVFIIKDDSKNSNLDKVAGVLAINSDGIGLNNSTSEDLLRFPVGNIKTATELDLGIISGQTDTPSSTQTLTALADKFDLSAEVLDELARTDDILRYVKNVIANTENDGSSYWSIEYFHVWYGSASNFKNNYSSVNNFTYNGYGFYMGGKYADLTFDQMCSPTSSISHKTIKFVPPQSISRGNTVFDSQTAATSLSNELVTTIETGSGGGRTCSGGEFYASANNDNSILNFNFGQDGYTGTSPAGEWKLYVDDLQVAGFDIAATSPVRSDGTAKLYVPVISATVDSSDHISSIEAKFQLYDLKSANYKEVTDLSTFKRSVGSNIAISCADYTAAGSNNQEYSQTMVNEADAIYKHNFTATWTYPGATQGSDPYCSALTLSYKVDGMAIRFRINP